MVVKISGISQLILHSAALVLKVNLAACHMCTLDDPSYKYCHSVQVQSAEISNRTDQVYSIYQCRDNCDRKLCLAFDYQVDASQNMKNCTLFLGKSTDETSLKSSSDCNGTKWWYAWLREGRGRIWDRNCHASREILNLALKKPSSQSSTQTDWSPVGRVASLANNGDSDGDLASKCSMTSGAEIPWWQVDLTRRANVLTVAIRSTNADGFLDPNNPFDIRVGYNDSNGGINNPLCVSSATLIPGQRKISKCQAGMQGKFVSVHLKKKGQLVLCEVEVYGVLLP
eukprot:Seg3476.3 transcript_id=Seg3476.3/GoldUCD/mRNA.D3Y31 product=Fucolectin-5 protein_id=Seg3476.3/GoldUCD/D3Y31